MQAMVVNVDRVMRIAHTRKVLLSDGMNRQGWNVDLPPRLLTVLLGKFPWSYGHHENEPTCSGQQHGEEVNFPAHHRA